MMLRLLITLPMLTTMLLASGCTSVRQTFDGYQPAEVWTALLAVAESPEYDDRHVVTNEVWTAGDEARIEIFRQTQRYVNKPRTKPRTERREWRFQVLLLDTDPPSASFISRGWAVPGHAREEALRYFDDVWAILDRGEEAEPQPVGFDGPPRDE